MPWKELKSFKIKDYKCFKPENGHQGFEDLRPINVIIGKNNSGKSKILEFLKIYVEKNKPEMLFQLGHNILIKKSLIPEELQAVFSPRSIGGPIGNFALGGNNHWTNAGAHLVGKDITCTQNHSEISGHPFQFNHNRETESFNNALKVLIDHLRNPFKDYRFISINAERDLQKEHIDFNKDEYPLISSDGRNVTALIAFCLSSSKSHNDGMKSYIEQEFLKKMNAVLFPDIELTRIYPLASGQNNQWEIHLEEKDKGGIKLSDCGSGLKTIIFTMAVLYLTPRIEKNKKNIFAFEELENNLHPSLERKLLTHIRDYIKENPDSLLFLTTHSNVAIDLFSRDDSAQIVRAYNDGKASYLEQVDNWTQQHNLLDELGVKASDVLQSNCVVWLEGPSDRIYLNKWIKLFNEGDSLEDGVHYECVFYGGSILSHFTTNPEDEEQFIKMLKINRNAVILMDSDKAKDDESLKPRVSKIIKESLELPNTLTWVTEGREIENYLTKEIIDQYFSTETTFKKFDIFANKYKTLKNVKTFDKVGFAADITNQEYYTKDALKEHLDLKENVLKVISHIRSCNED